MKKTGLYLMFIGVFLFLTNHGAYARQADDSAVTTMDQAWSMVVTALSSA